MDKKELVEILTEHFPTKDDFSNLVRRVISIEHELDIFSTKVNEKLDDLKASSGALDKILEQQPIRRIERLESHVSLPPFSSVVHDE